MLSRGSQFFCTLVLTTTAVAPVLAQNEQQLERLLNSVDQPQVWQQTPPAAAGRTPSFTAPQLVSPQYQASPWRATSPYPSGPQAMPSTAFPGQMLPFQGQSYRAPNQLQSPFASLQNRPGVPPINRNPGQPGGGGGVENPFSRQNLLRAFLGGSGGSTGGPNNSARDASAVGTAQSNLQTALSEAAQAESDEGRARYGGDKSSRLSAASSAQYHANAARAAADRASSVSYNGPSLARDYAAQARDAAYRAQGAADRARYNASQN